MTVNLLMEIYRAHLSNPCALDAFSQQMQSPNLMSPEEFDKYWDEPPNTQSPNLKTQHKKTEKSR